MPSLNELIDRLVTDPWRATAGLSPEIQSATTAVLSSASNNKKAVIALRDWLTKHQPCVFGRLGAGAPDLIECCIVTEDEARDSDARVQDKIQSARARWKRLAATGDKSGFVLLLAGPTLRDATPDQNLCKVAVRLFELYLPEERSVAVDTVYLDRIVLANEMGRSYRSFVVSSDVFAVQADGRWWNDHRIPGGLAFSFNSPGHMAAAYRQRVELLDAEQAAITELGLPGQLRRVQQAKAELQKLQRHPISSPGEVLKFAMKTVLNASARPATDAGPGWDRAVSLMRRHTGDSCPVKEVEDDAQLRRYDYQQYLGWYHTDYTIPSIFFDSPAQGRPPEACPYALDLRYIYDRKSSDHRQRMVGVRRSRQGN